MDGEYVDGYVRLVELTRADLRFLREGAHGFLAGQREFTDTAGNTVPISDLGALAVPVLNHSLERCWEMAVLLQAMHEEVEQLRAEVRRLSRE